MSTQQQAKQSSSEGLTARCGFASKFTKVINSLSAKGDVTCSRCGTSYRQNR